MASTIQLSRTINVTQNFIRNAPLTFSPSNDPAFTIGDWVRQFMLGPPFAWRWNRSVFTFQTVAGTQDYSFQNFLPNSQNLSGANWNPTTGVTIASNGSMDPVGNTGTVFRIQYNGSGVAGGARVSVTGTAVPVILPIGTPVTSSIYLRTNSGGPYALLLADNFGGQQPITVTGSWQRFSLSSTADGQSPVAFLIDEPTNVTLDLLGTFGQIETHPTATAYIATSTTAPVGALPNFGWLEMASIADNTPIVHELEVVLDLSEETVRNQPTRIAARLDDGNGSISFRLTPPPDKVYTVTLTYQNSPVLFSSTSQTWTPIPDYLSYLYNSGFSAKSYEYINDGRFGAMLTTFLRQVIAANGGLTDSQVNIFLTDGVNAINTQQAAMQNGQLGRQGRGLA